LVEKSFVFNEANLISKEINIDGFVKSLKIPFPVIPAKAGIQSFQMVINSLDSGFHRSDDFLRDHQYLQGGFSQLG
jgi:hypothetical protein